MLKRRFGDDWPMVPILLVVFLAVIAFCYHELTYETEAQNQLTTEERVDALENTVDGMIQFYNETALPPVAPASEVMFGGIAVFQPQYSFQMVCENDGTQVDQVAITCMRVDFAR